MVYFFSGFMNIWKNLDRIWILKDLKKRITEFKESLEFTENELHGKIKNLEEKHESIKKNR